MREDTDSLSQILSRLEINATQKKNDSYSSDAEGTDSLERFKEEFINFLSNNPHVVSSSVFVPANCKSLIVLSPLSTKHTFGREWVSKSYLSTIVERPQRLLACSMGIAAALSMYPAHFTLLSSTKRSPLTSPHVEKIHGKNWPAEIERICLESEAKLSQGKIEVPDDWNSGDIYLTKSSIEALEGVVGAIETTVDTIFKWDEESPRRAFVAIRPPGHHGHPCVPSGFCLINNAQVAIEYAAVHHDVTHAVILDFDLHHGDGTQDICWQRAGFEPDFGEKAAGYDDDDDDDDDDRDDSLKKDANGPKVGYFSLHDINSFPTETGFATPGNIKNASTCIEAHDLNIWNIHLQPYTTEEEFYQNYEDRYSILLKKADEYLERSKKEWDIFLKRHEKKSNSPTISKKPFKSLVVISAGFDASEYEVQTMQRHGVHVPTSFFSRFTSDAVKLANRHSDGVLLSLLEGGYSDGAISSGVFSHLIGLQRQKWENNWGNPEIVKELVKGCRPKWTPVKSPSTEMKQWANQVCKLGRSMMPTSIIIPQPKTPILQQVSRVERNLRSNNKLPAEKMVLRGDISILEDLSATPGVDSPIEQSTPTVVVEHEAGEFKHRFIKVNGEWKHNTSADK